MIELLAPSLDSVPGAFWAGGGLVSLSRSGAVRGEETSVDLLSEFPGFYRVFLRYSTDVSHVTVLGAPQT